MEHSSAATPPLVLEPYLGNLTSEPESLSPVSLPTTYQTAPSDTEGSHVGLANTHFLDSVHLAVSQDHRYREIYNTFRQTGHVHPLASENEWLSLMQTRFSSGGPAGSPNREDYKDAHVSVCARSRTLTVKHWLVAHPTLVIELGRVKYMRSAGEVVPDEGVEVWGLGTTGVGWARDGERVPPNGKGWEKSFVCCFEDGGEECVAGFTVDHPERFGLEMEALLPGVFKPIVKEDFGETQA